MKKNSSILFVVCLALTGSLSAKELAKNSQSALTSPLPSLAVGTWAYDGKYDAAGKKLKPPVPGLFVSEIQAYNNSAQAGHKLTQVFSYGGDLEIACQGTQGSDPGAVCNATNMWVYYAPGNKSTQAYSAINNIQIVPIVDGRLDQDKDDDYLSPLNNFDAPTAAVLADMTAKTYCADNLVAGLQVDIEPFDITQDGQYYFYQRLADDLAGTEPSCVNTDHPNGRYFSVFTFAKNIYKPGNSQIATRIASIFNQHQNFYIQDSLYDLGTNPGGTVNSVDDYKVLVDAEVKDMMAAAKKAGNIKFQFGIAAAASAHEFESKAGVSTGYKQIDYVKAAINAINNNSARQDTNYIGINVWSWNDTMWWGGDKYTPASPSADVLAYLANNL